MKTFPGVRALDGVSFEAREGSVHALMGENGAGKSTLLKILSGAYAPTEGRLVLDGKPLGSRTIRGALEAGVAVIYQELQCDACTVLRDGKHVRTFDRLGDIAPDDLVRAMVGREVDTLNWVKGKAEGDYAQKRVAQFRVKTPSVDVRMGNLSGGNQQKAILGRVLGHELKVLLLDEPTRGIDVGAKGEVHEIVRGLAETGVAVLVVSSEMPELLGLCDRILVMEGGRLTGELDHADATQERLLELALPGKTP